jgi:DNA (cytosine-5)-methyltransferase 1
MTFVARPLNTNTRRFDPTVETLLINTYGVRRLIPDECALLQGFPLDWNATLSDAARYRQFGNAVCVPVATWLGRRILNVATYEEEGG